jgi:hypothetical protein
MIDCSCERPEFQAVFDAEGDRPVGFLSRARARRRGEENNDAGTQGFEKRLPERLFPRPAQKMRVSKQVSARALPFPGSGTSWLHRVQIYTALNDLNAFPPRSGPASGSEGGSPERAGGMKEGNSPLPGCFRTPSLRWESEIYRHQARRSEA